MLVHIVMSEGLISTTNPTNSPKYSENQLQLLWANKRGLPGICYCKYSMNGNKSKTPCELSFLCLISSMLRVDLKDYVYLCFILTIIVLFLFFYEQQNKTLKLCFVCCRQSIGNYLLATNNFHSHLIKSLRNKDDWQSKIPKRVCTF